MKNRRRWVVVTILGLLAGALALARWRLGPRKIHPEIVIQDGTTIDFSSGKPVIKDTAKEKASIEKAVKEMEEAAQGVTFTSPTPPAAPPKKAEAKK